SIQRAAEYPGLQELRSALEQLTQRLQSVTAALLGDLGAGKVNETLANSALYMKVFGHAVVGWRWLEQAIRAEEGLARGNAADGASSRGKLQAECSFPTSQVRASNSELTLPEARAETCMEMQDSSA